MACDLETLVSESACYDCLSDSENKDAYLFLLAKTLVAEGGADYTDINALRAAVKCYCGLGGRIEAFKAQVAQDLAVRAGAYGSAPSINTIREAVKCWECGVGNDERRAMEVFLLCSLFTALDPGT